jgi:predicted nuclease with TOPRIM domain
MERRKCIYTGQEANYTDSVIPKRNDEARHNWANKVPANSNYQKSNRLPTDLEMEASRLFYMLEMAKNEVNYLELKLQEVQEKITGKKAEEIEKAYHIKDLTESFEEQVRQSEDTAKKNIWDEF